MDSTNTQNFNFFEILNDFKKNYKEKSRIIYEFSKQIIEKYSRAI